MTLPGWLCAPEKRAELPARLLLALAVIWACFRTARSVVMLFSESHDLDIYYSLWFLLKHREYADIALSQALYLPHTWLVLTPLFLLGWPAAKALMLLINVTCVFYIWWRLCQLAGLAGIRRWLMLALFWGWLGTGLVIGLGNLALVCVAAAVAAYPFTTAGNSVFLTLAAMKQSLVFPLYFHLLFKRPKVLILPFVVFALSGLAILFWSRLSLAEGLKLAKASAETANAWTLYDFTCMRRLVAPFIHNSTAVTIVVWVVWFALFGICAKVIKEPLTHFAALLLLSLLPMYHQRYDLVAAAPALAICLRRCSSSSHFARHTMFGVHPLGCQRLPNTLKGELQTRLDPPNENCCGCSLVWPAVMTAALASDIGITFSRFLPAGPLRNAGHSFELAYYPLLTLALLAGLVLLDLRQSRSPCLPQAQHGGNQPQPG